MVFQEDKQDEIPDRIGPYFLSLSLHNLGYTIYSLFPSLSNPKGDANGGNFTAVGERMKATFWQVFIYSTWKILLGLTKKVLAQLCSADLSLSIASDMPKCKSFYLYELQFPHGFNKDEMSYYMWEVLCKRLDFLNFYSTDCKATLHKRVT